jgi:hypothetical protein
MKLRPMRTELLHTDGQKKRQDESNICFSSFWGTHLNIGAKTLRIRSHTRLALTTLYRRKIDCRSRPLYVTEYRKARKSVERVKRVQIFRVWALLLVPLLP